MLAVIAGEILVRSRERQRSTVPGTITMLYYQHGRLGHALVRKTDYFGWMQINSQGFRGPEVLPAKTEATIRIMVVGASTAFDTQVTGDDKTWVARLEHWLRELAPGKQLEVINAGAPGYEVLDNVIRLQTELFRFQPDVVVLYQAHNDISCALSSARRQKDPRRPDQIPIATPWGRWLQQHSLLYNKLVARFTWIRLRRETPDDKAEQSTPEPEESSSRCGPAQFERDVSLFVTVCQTLGIRPVLTEVVHVSGSGALEERDDALRERWLRARPYADPDSSLRLYARYNAILRDVASRFSVTFIPTADFDLVGADWFSTLDPMHFNDRGADRMGQAMAEALRASGVLGTEVGSGAD
jgi:lysophospholipase L1-like esterase